MFNRQTTGSFLLARYYSLCATFSACDPLLPTQPLVTLIDLLATFLGTLYNLI